jgi:3',5'-cyclic AMP phosphodiesterase CpdA
MAQKTQMHFIAMVGDNFYPKGIQSVSDPVVKEVFLENFGDLKVPFHPVLGDNDYGDNEIVGSLQSQVDLSQTIPNWAMPQLFYSRIIREGAVSLCALFIDTQSMISIPHIDKRSPTESSVLEGQMNWIESTLSSRECSESTFVVVFGHHAIKSTGKKHKKGKSKAVVDKLSPIFDKYKVDAYVSGHDHDLQFIEESLESLENRHIVSYIVSGAASRLRKHPVVVDIPGHRVWAVRDLVGYTIFESAISETTGLPILLTSFIRSENDQILHVQTIRSHVDLRRQSIPVQK